MEDDVCACVVGSCNIVGNCSSSNNGRNPHLDNDEHDDEEEKQEEDFLEAPKNEDRSSESNANINNLRHETSHGDEEHGFVDNEADEALDVDFNDDKEPEFHASKGRRICGSFPSNDDDDTSKERLKGPLVMECESERDEGER